MDYDSVFNISTISPEDLEEHTYTPYSERPETYIVPAVFFIIFVVGVLGNGTLIIIFLRHRNMRNVPNTYIFSLALADLLVIVTCVPFTSVIYTVPSWPWGPSMCKISETVKCISIGVSVFTLTALSAERYCAIVNPLRRLQTKPLTVISAVFIWFLAFLLSLPDAIMSHLEEIPLSNESSIMICMPFPDAPYQEIYKKYSVAAKAIVYYILPLTIISFFYVLMSRRLHKSTKEMPGEIQGQNVMQTKARKHVARMVLAFVFLFFICFFPYHVYMLWFVFYPNSEAEYNDYWHALKIVGFCLGFFNSCVNPIALYCVSGVFRAHYNRYLCCKSSKLLQRSKPSHTTYETSFNSTYRRTTQGPASDMQGTQRKIIRQTKKDGTLIALETLNSKDYDVTTTLIRSSSKGT